MTFIQTSGILLVVLSTPKVKVLKEVIKTLTERELLILEQIVREYTENDRPVGSKALVAVLPIKVSSATIRNDMAKLEEMGLIQKNHSSSGRIPSLKGYRYYVDHLIHPLAIKDDEVKKIHDSIGSQFDQVDDIVKTSTEMLSELTHYTVLSLKPNHEGSMLEGFRMVPLGNNSVMLILVADNGEVTSRKFMIPNSMTGEDLERVVRVLNDRLIGHPLSEVYATLTTNFQDGMSKYLKTSAGIIDVFSDVVSKYAANQFFVGGRLNVLNFSRTDDLNQIKNLLGMFNETDKVKALVGNPGDDLNVRIGDELRNSLLEDYSLVTATYDVGQHGQGMIAVLGPTSMQYSRMLGLVDAFRGQLAGRLIDYYQNIDDS
ncbi:heat-inducible transcription repressor HrcA [Pediococcus argentinicus]|nr:heat-inducible transcriptional repressor HrcA [Pediococcus argentinicus]GEP18630.1 heat-inducible transcription repressor HrcA [Pediococcus argentinicus]